MARSALITGATVSLYVNGVAYAKVTSFQFGISTPTKEIRGCDSAQPFELAAMGTSVSGSLGILRQSQDGGAEGAGLCVPISQVSKAKYVSLMLIEMSSNTVLFESRRSTITEQTWGANTHAYVTGNISFSSIDYTNEVRAIQ